MTYTTFDGHTQTAIEEATSTTIDSVAAYGKAMADSLQSNGEMTLQQHNIVYHNIDGWVAAIKNGTTPPDWERPL